ncbi:GerAB/ArcD/ProY family transporter [Paenibacillus sp. 1P07SE]|uniref:GerAB/ArcD/ProY family transporter n=1 Tax=Paenibacillus sp. 1P07SE TaxID=3132209 RepID=UPI0039A44C4A
MVKLSSGQVYRIAFVYLYSAPISYLIQRLFKMSDYQGWLSVLGGYALSLLFLFFTIKLGRTFPERGWADFGSDIVGKGLHRVFLLLIGIFVLILASFDVQNFIIFLRTIYLPDTPVWILVILTVLCIALTSRAGLLTIVYMSEGVFLLQLVASLFVIPTVIEVEQIAIVQSLITHHDLTEFATGSLSVMPWFSEWGLFLFLAPLTSFLLPLGRALMLGGLTVVVILIIYWLLALMTFGPFVGKELQYPLLELVRFAPYSDFMSKLDPVLIYFWSATMFMRTSFQIYIAAFCFSRLMGMKDHKPFVFLVVGSLTAFVLQYAADTIAFEAALRTYGVSVYATLMDSFPIVYMLVYWMRFGSIPNNRPVPAAKPPP